MPVDVKSLEILLRKVFTQKRKKISNGMKQVHDDAGGLLDLCGVDRNLRPEQISVRDWCLLANVFKSSIFYDEVV